MSKVRYLKENKNLISIKLTKPKKLELFYFVIFRDNKFLISAKKLFFLDKKSALKEYERISIKTALDFLSNECTEIQMRPKN